MTTYAVPDSFDYPLTYQMNLDGASYSARIFFLYYGQRTYMTLTNQYGKTIFTMPLIGSSHDAKPINMAAGYFTTSTMYYYPVDQLIVVAP